MDRRSGDTNRRKNIVIFTQNSNGNPMNQRLTREAVDNIAKNDDVIAIFNDIRCQDPSNIHLPNFSTILANDKNNLHYAGGSCILFPNTWSATIQEQECKEGLIVELTTSRSESVV